MSDLSKQKLLQYVKEYIHGVPSVYEEGTDWDEVFHCAAGQSLEGIVFHQCKHILPQEQKRKHIKEYLSNTTISFEREKTIANLLGHIESEGIQIMFMKGSVLRDYYPLPALRSMGDIDIIVQQNDKEKLDRILRQEMGFQRFIDNHAVWTYWKGRIYLEIHNQMFYEVLANDFDYTEYFDHIFEHKRHGNVFGLSSEHMYIPDENYHFLYLMAHTAKHIINNGAGFRAYIDMVMMAQKCSLDWEWLKEELRRMELLNFTETCFALCERWFNVRMPLGHKELEEEFFNRITEKTFNDGIFGLNNEENEGAHSAKEIKRDNKGYWFTAIRLTLKILFPSYEDFILGPNYSFFIGKPWLLPVGWVYRWIYCITHQLIYSIRRVTEPFAKRNKIEKREKYIKDWGL